jgi:sulfoxide reductase heme-binding subunit YedZ
LKETDVAPWTDYQGRIAPLKLATFVALFGPGLSIIWQWVQGDLAPKPVTEALHQTGTWAVHLLLISLAITPIRTIAHWPRLVDIRRMVGVAACLYLGVHFALYILDQKGDMLRVMSEIALRFYLTIGFVALLGIVALGITSTDGWVRRLGAVRWNKLHRTIYWLTVLAFIHAFLQSKLDVSDWVMLSGLFFAMMMWRFAKARGQTGFLPLVVIALAATLATGLVEALWYWGKTGVMASRVLAANFDPDMAVRPAQWVLIYLLLVLPLQAFGRWRGLKKRKAVA